MNWRKSVLMKKIRRYSFELFRQYYKIRFTDKDYRIYPPILANSFPKSGTHLLIQILQAIPDIRDWGAFLSSTPSFTFKEVSEANMARKISMSVPNELISAHLHYSGNIAELIQENHILHFFIYRDLRDVAISEAYYLTYMNKWHGLHRYFKALPDMNSRILFSIQGATDPSFPYYYPDIGTRFNRYKLWISNSHSHALKYEDLIGSNSETTVKNIVRYYLKHTTSTFDEETLTRNALDNINPQKSHTYRRAKSGGWKSLFTSEHREVFLKCAGSHLIEAGYERDHSW